MTYYGGKELAEAFRTVRKNRFKSRRTSPKKHDFKATRIENHPPDARASESERCSDHRARRQAERHERPGLPGILHQDWRRGVKPRNKAEIIAMLKTDGNKFGALLESFPDSFSRKP
jgi:hypothetical protein